MSSLLDILSAVENLDCEQSEEERRVRVLQQFEQQFPKERAKRLTLEFAIGKCRCSIRDINFIFALNQVKNKSFTDFRKILEQNLKMQEKLVDKVKSHDWELINSLWTFKFNALQELKKKMVQQFRKHQDFWEMKMCSIPELNDMQKTRKLFEQKQQQLFELGQRWKVRKEPVDIKHQRTNRHFQEINLALDSCGKVVANLKQEAENLEAEVKRLDASKLEETRLIKNVEKDMKKRRSNQTIEVEKKENSKYYRGTRQISCIDVFKVSPFILPKMQKKSTIRKSILEEKDGIILIEDRKRYTSMITKIPENLVDFQKQISGNFSQRENRQPGKIENIKLKPDKQIKILEHVILKSSLPDTTKETGNEQSDISVVGPLNPKIPKILNTFYQNKIPTDVNDLKQYNEEAHEGKLFDGQLMKQNVFYRTQMGEKVDRFHSTESNTIDENKTNQPKRVEYMNVFEKQLPENILKRENLQAEENDKVKIPKIDIKDEKCKRRENEGIANRNMFVNETKPDPVLLKIDDKELHKNTGYREKTIKIGKAETDEIHVNKTSNNVKKRKSDKPSSVEENLNAKQFKSKVDNYDSISKLDSKPVQPVGTVIGDHSGSENEMEKILRKAFEFCGVGENTDKNLKDADINLNDDFEGFCNQLNTSELFMKDPENDLEQNSDDASGWGAFGNNFKFSHNYEDNDFLK